MLAAFGLLVPRPHLIVELLQHQCQLTYWCTKVCIGYQPTPYLASASRYQGRLYYASDETVLFCAIVLALPSTAAYIRIPRRGITTAAYATPQGIPHGFIRLRSIKDWNLGDMTLSLHRGAYFFKVQK